MRFNEELDNLPDVDSDRLYKEKLQEEAQAKLNAK